eukprot:4709944-Pleurochrysis_carterae.AAC.1
MGRERVGAATAVAAIPMILRRSPLRHAGVIWRQAGEAGDVVGALVLQSRQSRSARRSCCVSWRKQRIQLRDTKRRMDAAEQAQREMLA